MTSRCKVSLVLSVNSFERNKLKLSNFGGKNVELCRITLHHYNFFLVGWPIEIALTRAMVESRDCKGSNLSPPPWIGTYLNER